VRLHDQDWFRVSPLKNDNFFLSVRNLVDLLGDTHTPTLAIGLSSFGLILGLKLWRRTRKIPGALVLVVVFIIVMIIWNKSIDSHGAWTCLAADCVVRVFLTCHVPCWW
jgi:MFS superfamily sulfate permease-like transporter